MCLVLLPLPGALLALLWPSSAGWRELQAGQPGLCRKGGGCSVQSSSPLPFPQECSLSESLGPCPDAEQAAWKFSRRVPRRRGLGLRACGGSLGGSWSEQEVRPHSPTHTYRHTMVGGL